MKTIDPAGNPTGGVSVKEFTKTVYDPDIWTDEKLRIALGEAVGDAITCNGDALAKEWSGVTSDGIRIRGFSDANGNVTSFFFE